MSQISSLERIAGKLLDHGRDAYRHDPEEDPSSQRLHSMAKEAGLQKDRFLAKKGDVLIWSASLMHGGSPVESPIRTRKSLVTHYCPADLQPMYAYKGGRPKRSAVGGHYIISERWE